MCLILFAFRYHPQYRLVLAANRDEFYDRPSQSLHFWKDDPQVAAGRDLKQMGTWMGVTRQGRLAAITNYRQPDRQKALAPSRGHIVADFLTGKESAISYLKRLSSKSSAYNGFNLILGDRQGLFYYSNRGPSDFLQLEPGLYGLSNHLLDTDWPKVHHGKADLQTIVKKTDGIIDHFKLRYLLENQKKPTDDQLPHTGIGIEWERILAPIFITSPLYGTRSSSILTIDNKGKVDFTEITWQSAKSHPIASRHESIQFSIHDDGL